VTETSNPAIPNPAIPDPAISNAAVGTGYVPGSWVAMTAADLWLLADVAPQEAVVTRCWQLIRAGSDVDDLLAAIVREGFRSVASFALVHRAPDQAHVVVRGGAQVELHFAHGAVTDIRNAGSSDWIERHIDGSTTSFRLNPVGQTVPATEALLPLDAGVVLASSLEYQTHEPIPEAAQPAERLGSSTDQAPAPNLDRFSLTADFLTDDLPQADPVPVLPLSPVLTPAPAQAPVLAPSPPSVEDDGIILSLPWTLQSPTDAPAASAPLIESFDPSADLRIAAPITPPITPPAAEPSREFAGLSADAAATTFRPNRAPLGPGSGADEPVVLASRCPAGHLNPAQANACRICGAAVPAQQPVAVTRPPLGRLRLSTGDVIALDRGVIFGRIPTVPDGHPGPRPHVVRLGTADGDISDVSRNHVEIRLEGWQVVAVDLGSTNGTSLSRPDLAGTRLLPPLVRQPIEPGSILTLAPDIWIAYEVTG
jgi:hypothetical protein